MTTRSQIVAAGATVSAFTILLLVAASAVFCASTLRVRRAQIYGLATLKAQHHEGRWQVAAVRASDHIQLQAWFGQPANTNGSCAILLHGIADSRTGSLGFAPLFLNEGYSVLIPDSRAHGESGGEFVTYGLLEKYDVLLWAHWLRQAGCQKLYGLGESLGGSVLIQASALEPIFSAIVAECPYADLQVIAQYRLEQMWRLPLFIAHPASKVIVTSGIIYARFRYGLDLTQVAPLSSIRRSSTPILLIHGLQDFKTPSWHSQALAKANPHAALWLVPDAGHTNASSVDPSAFQHRVLSWFSRH